VSVEPSGFQSRFPRSVFIALVLFAAALFLVGLDRCAMHRKSEARTTVVAQEMMASGQWGIPTLGGDLRFEKPPLYYWLICLAAAMTGGEVGDFAARLPSALSGLGLVVLVFFWTRAFIKRSQSTTQAITWAPPLAALIVLTSPLLLQMARRAEIDTALALFTSLAGYCFWRMLAAQETEAGPAAGRVFGWLGYGFIGLAVMVKGPIGLLVPLVPLWVVGLRGGPRRWRWGLHGLGWAIVLAISLPWPIYVMKVIGAEGGGTFWSEIAMRFSSEGKHAGPFYHYFGTLLGMLPVLALTLPWAVVRWWKIQRQPAERYLLWTLLANLILFSVFSSKRDRYLLPLLPAAAILVSWWLVREHSMPKRISRALWIALGLVGLLAIAGAFLIPAFSLALLTIGIALAVGTIHRRMNPPVHLTITLGWLALLGALQWGFSIEIEPRLAYWHGERPFAERIQRHTQPGDRWFFSGKFDPVLQGYLGFTPKKIDRPDEILKKEKSGGYLLAYDDFQTLEKNPRWVKVFNLPNDKKPQEEYAVFSLASATQDRLSAALAPGPLRLAAIPNANLDRSSRLTLAQRLEQRDEATPLDGILVPDGIFHDLRLSRPDRLWREFEKPYQALLQRGIPFYTPTGNWSGSASKVLLGYPPLRMQGQRYRKHSLREGFCDLFVLDVADLVNNPQDANPPKQWPWLKDALAQSRARWKVVLLHRLSELQKATGEEYVSLRTRIEGLCERYGVQIVISADESGYRRLESSSKKAGITSFRVGDSEEEATVFLELDRTEARYHVTDRTGKTIDQGVIPLRAALE